MTGGAYEVEEEFAFLGRTFGEYRRMFDIDPVELSGRTVLDCPGGPSSFTAIASELADEVVAVDPMYGRPVDELDAVCRDTIDRTLDQLREKRNLFVWDYYGDPETRCRYQRAAAARFLADYARYPERYVAAALPDLPFQENAFDRVLSANFLFLYDDRLDRTFHDAAMEELLRVAREEVRVFTLAALDGDRSELVDPIAASLQSADWTPEFRAVPTSSSRERPRCWSSPGRGRKRSLRERDIDQGVVWSTPLSLVSMTKTRFKSTRRT